MPFDGTPVRRPDWEFTWDEAAIERLKELHASGMTGQQIADELGCGSRSAVLGKLDRLRRAEFKRTVADTGGGTQRAIAARVAREARAPLRKARPMAMPEPIPEPIPEPEPEPGPVTIIGLRDWSCRWIINDDVSRALYCGRPRDPDSTGCYCSEHRRIAYVRSPAPRSQPSYRQR
jgi:hypothetical protein